MYFLRAKRSWFPRFAFLLPWWVYEWCRTLPGTRRGLHLQRHGLICHACCEPAWCCKTIGEFPVMWWRWRGVCMTKVWEHVGTKLEWNDINKRCRSITKSNKPRHCEVSSQILQGTSDFLPSLFGRNSIGYDHTSMSLARAIFISHHSWARNVSFQKH